MKIVAIILLVVSAFLGLKHGWDAFHPATGQQAEMMTGIGVTKSMMPYIGVFSVMVALMLFFPQTFFLANVLQAISIVLIMALSLRSGNSRIALIEIPFLAMPLLLIWLRYPLRF